MRSVDQMLEDFRANLTDEQKRRLAREAHRDRCEALVPELVAALRRILHIAKSDAPTAFADVVQEARAVLAKAEGGAA